MVLTDIRFLSNILQYIICVLPNIVNHLRDLKVKQEVPMIIDEIIL